jgi:hypothetical protein
MVLKCQWFLTDFKKAIDKIKIENDNDNNISQKLSLHK